MSTVMAVSSSGRCLLHQSHELVGNMLSITFGDWDRFVEVHCNVDNGHTRCLS